MVPLIPPQFPSRVVGLVSQSIVLPNGKEYEFGSLPVGPDTVRPISCHSIR